MIILSDYFDLALTLVGHYYDPNKHAVFNFAVFLSLAQRDEVIPNLTEYEFSMYLFPTTVITMIVQRIPNEYYN